MPRLSAVTRRMLGIGDDVAATALAARLTRAAVSAETAINDRKRNFNGAMGTGGDLRPAGEKFRQWKCVSFRGRREKSSESPAAVATSIFIGNRRTTDKPEWPLIMRKNGLFERCHLSGEKGISSRTGFIFNL